MPLAVLCPGCRVAIQVPDTLNGKAMQCGKCGQRFLVKTPAAATPRRAADPLPQAVRTPSRPAGARPPPRPPALHPRPHPGVAGNPSSRRWPVLLVVGGVMGLLVLTCGGGLGLLCLFIASRGPAPGPSAVALATAPARAVPEPAPAVPAARQPAANPPPPAPPAGREPEAGAAGGGDNHRPLAGGEHSSKAVVEVVEVRRGNDALLQISWRYRNPTDKEIQVFNDIKENGSRGSYAAAVTNLTYTFTDGKDVYRAKVVRDRRGQLLSTLRSEALVVPAGDTSPLFWAKFLQPPKNVTQITIEFLDTAPLDVTIPRG